MRCELKHSRDYSESSQKVVILSVAKNLLFTYTTANAASALVSVP